ncbi:hypothetical protein A0128_14190 [Leptospira tipperaryensis]|uniref:DUF3995 domain-containing protein n=1 Tax=Leptospira tipperaryensis TaxID=2564040 RepID=A0A1D7UZ76_9LEPT|nr:DUF3995 domain-containing protein [Leptospira tipperaryensis]AOP34893.1 hypothetical protein A0128_14190 [Leptospira tipperaryensis]
MTSFQPILSWIVGLILFFLSGIHFYWLVGGQTGGSKVIPELNGKPTFRPGKLSTALVGILLFCAALLPIGLTLEIPFGIPKTLFHYGTFFLSVVFLLRAVGDFRMVGFFKSIRDTTFAKYDTKYYCPLCLLISTLLFFSAI